MRLKKSENFIGNVLGWICTIKLSWAVLASEIKENSFAGINT
jgi:hypothetical protein